MQRWLLARHQPVPDADAPGHTMPGMDHPMLMPGMLSSAQLAQLDAARGPEFDRLFLTFMIQHTAARSPWCASWSTPRRRPGRAVVSKSPPT